VFLLAAFASSAFPADEKEKAATDAAAQWLALVDSGQYGESWFQAATTFRNAVSRNAVSKEQWKNAIDSTRAPMGKVVSGQFKSATYTTKVPNASAGEDVIIQYATSYERVPHIVETVTPMLEKDGKWKVSGYYVKRSGG